MLLAKNPTDSVIAEYIARSDHNAAKWIKDLDTGDLYYWPADGTRHARIAKVLHVTDYDKGIAVDD